MGRENPHSITRRGVLKFCAATPFLIVAYAIGDHALHFKNRGFQLTTPQPDALINPLQGNFQRLYPENIKAWPSALLNVKARLGRTYEQKRENMFFYAAPQFGMLEQQFQIDYEALKGKSKEVILEYLRQRRDAISLYLSRYYSYLNQVDSAQQRAHIDVHHFYEQMKNQQERMVELGFHEGEYDTMIDTLAYMNAQVLIKHGYDVKILMHGNPKIATQQREIQGAEGYRIFAPLRNQNDYVFDSVNAQNLMLNMYLRLIGHLKHAKNNQDQKIEFIYGNEVDMLDFIIRDELSMKGMSTQTQIMTPQEYWNDYYTLAGLLADNGVILRPCAFSTEWDDEIVLEAWLQAQSQAQSQFGRQVEDGLRINIYGMTAQEVMQKIDRILQINSSITGRNSLAGIQETGILAWQGDADYATTLTHRQNNLAELLSAVDKLRLSEKGIFGMPLEMAATEFEGDGSLKDAMSQEAWYDGHHIMYLNEDELWKIITQFIKNSV